MKILCGDWLHLRSLSRDNHLSGLFKMVASLFVEVTDKEIKLLFKENAHFSNNHLIM